MVTGWLTRLIDQKRSRFYPVAVVLLLLSFGVSAELRVEALFSGKAMVNLEGKRELISVGKRGQNGVMLISADSEKAVLEYQGKTFEAPLSSAISTRFSSAEKKTVTISADDRRQYFTQGSINGQPVRFLVDTGASLIAMNSGQAERLGIQYRLKGRKGRVATASGTESVYLVKLDRVKVGEIEIRNVDAGVLVGDFPLDVLLGTSFLQHLDMREEKGILYLMKKY